MFGVRGDEIASSSSDKRAQANISGKFVRKFHGLSTVGKRLEDKFKRDVCPPI